MAEEGAKRKESPRTRMERNGFSELGCLEHKQGSATGAAPAGRNSASRGTGGQSVQAKKDSRGNDHSAFKIRKERR